MDETRGADEPNVVEQRVASLLGQQAETRSLDYKGPMEFGPDRPLKAKVVKCLMAFANSQDGGSMLIGVKEDAGKFVPDGLTPEQADSFDQSKIGDFARTLCSELPDFIVYRAEVGGALLVLIEIREFREEPILATKDVSDGDKPIMRRGALYIRTEDAKCEEPKSDKEMRRLIRLAVRKQGDALIGQIRELVGSRAASVEPPDSGLFAAELSETEAFFLEHSLPPTGAFWQFSLRPLGYEPERWPREKLREARQEAQVSLRGWNVPHIGRENDENFEGGVQSWTEWQRYIEAHRLYRSGLVFWRRRLWEDSAMDWHDSSMDESSLSYVSAIWSTTEHLLFMSRYAELLFGEGEVLLDWTVSGLAGRHLRTERGSGVHLSLDYQTQAKQLHRSLTTSVADLRGGWRDIATDWTLELLELFQFQAGRVVIQDWQTKLIERKF
jgi:hypothetical protein